LRGVVFPLNKGGSGIVNYWRVGFIKRKSDISRPHFYAFSISCFSSSGGKLKIGTPYMDRD